MDPTLFFPNLLFTIAVVAIAMLYTTGIEALRITLILTLRALSITVMFVAHNIWRTVAPKSGKPS